MSPNNFWESHEFSKVTEKMRFRYSLLDSHRIMFRDLTKLISTFAESLTRWCDQWGKGLAYTLDDGTSATSGLTFLVDAARAMAASHATAAEHLSTHVVDPLAQFPKTNYRKNWMGRLKDAVEFEEECEAAQAPLLHAVKKMEKAKRLYLDNCGKVTRVEQQIDGHYDARASAKLVKLCKEEEAAKVVFDNSVLFVTYRRRNCRVKMSNAYDKVSTWKEASWILDKRKKY